jgi:protein-tyrosine-phosphatase
LPGVEIESAGFHQTTGRHSPEKMLRIASTLGVNLSRHRSARANTQQLLGADLVIAMDLENLNLLKQEFPEALPRTTLLGLFADPPSVSIADPYSADASTTREICEQVRAGIDGLAAFLDRTSRLPVSQLQPESSQVPITPKS